MTALLKGQAMYLALGSTSVTCNARSLLFSARAQLAPAKPPPTTTTRGALLSAARAIGRPNAASTPPAATPRSTARRLLLVGTRVPLCNGVDLFIRKTLGDAVHHGCRTSTGTKCLQRRHDLLRRQLGQRRHRASIRRRRMTAQARGRTGRCFTERPGRHHDTH